MNIYLIYNAIVEVCLDYHTINGTLYNSPFDITAFPDSAYERLI